MRLLVMRPVQHRPCNSNKGSGSEIHITIDSPVLLKVQLAMVGPALAEVECKPSWMDDMSGSCPSLPSVGSGVSVRLLHQHLCVKQSAHHTVWGV